MTRRLVTKLSTFHIAPGEYEASVLASEGIKPTNIKHSAGNTGLDNISKSFGDKEDIVVCVGDWSNAQGSCIKGASTMSVGLKRLVNKKYTTLLLDEYNTSKKCCNCWEDTENVKVGGDKKFRLLKCGGCDRKKKDIGSPEDEYKTMFNSYMTRDKNSCVNMMSIVKHMIYNKRTRPEPFCRS
jgi:hypothetical protein